MLGSLTVLPGAALEARRQGRPAARPARRPAAAATTARAASGARSSTASCAGRCCPPCSPAACCWRSPRRRSSCAWRRRGRTRSRKSLAVVKTYNRMQQAFPGTALPANVVVKAPDVNAPAVREAIGELKRRALASGRVARADHGRRSTRTRHGREHHRPDRRHGHRRGVERRARGPARRDRPADRRRAPERRGRRHRAHGRMEGLSGPDEVEAAARVRLRAPVRVRADAGRVPLDRRRDQGDRAQPALGRRRVRRARARLPARRRQGPARLQLDRGDRRRSCRCCCS